MSRSRVLKAAAVLATAAAALVVALPGLAADGVTPGDVSVKLAPGASTDISKTAHLDAAPAKADVVLAVDTTGSMSAAIGQAKSDATDIVTGVQTAIPGARFAVVNFDDYPISPYGAPGDVPYELLQPLTSSATDVQTAIDSLYLHNGADTPEAYNRVFYESYSDPALTYDPAAVKLLVVLGDSVPHDPDQAATFPDCWNSYPDPGPDGIVGTADDLYTKPTLDGMVAANVKLLFVDYGSAACHHELATYTGGSNVAAGSGGSLADEIVTLVETAAAQIKGVEIQVSPAAFASWVSETPAAPYGPFTAPVDFGWTETITAPADAAPGLYEFDVDVVADGATRATEHVTVRVNAPPDCSGVAASTPVLWSPNHKLVSETLAGASDADGDPLTYTIGSIRQDEPTDTTGDGATSPDAAYSGSGAAFQVRAERSGLGDGRFYVVTGTVGDGLAQCSFETTVVVPHDASHTPVLSSPLYDSLH